MAASVTHFEPSPSFERETGTGCDVVEGLRKYIESEVQNDIAVRNSMVVEAPSLGSVTNEVADTINFIASQGSNQLDESIGAKLNRVLKRREDSSLSSDVVQQFLPVATPSGSSLYAANRYWYDRIGFVLDDKDFINVCQLDLDGIDVVSRMNSDVLVLRAIISAVSDVEGGISPNDSEGLYLLGWARGR